MNKIKGEDRNGTIKTSHSKESDWDLMELRLDKLIAKLKYDPQGVLDAAIVEHGAHQVLVMAFSRVEIEALHIGALRHCKGDIIAFCKEAVLAAAESALDAVHCEMRRGARKGGVR